MQGQFPEQLGYRIRSAACGMAGGAAVFGGSVYFLLESDHWIARTLQMLTSGDTGVHIVCISIAAMLGASFGAAEGALTADANIRARSSDGR